MATYNLVGTAEEKEVFNAILNHDVARFRKAIKNGFCLDEIFNIKPLALYYCNALMHAVSCDFRKGIEILLRETDVHTRFGFITALNARNDDVIGLFLQVACERQRCFSEYLFLMLYQRLLDMAREFIQMDGFNVDDRELYLPGEFLRCRIGRYEQSPLHVSVALHETQLSECLIDLGAKLDIKDANDFTPLYVASVHGSYECCQSLLRHGANPTVNDSTKPYWGSAIRSPLYALCCLSEPPANEAIVGLLLSAGLDMNKEKWILDRSLTFNIADETLGLLMSSCGVPSTLEVTCVRAIRDHLSQLTAGKSILERVKGLPVPLLLKARLTMSDVDQCL